jgi:hypothetical protein
VPVRCIFPTGYTTCTTRTILAQKCPPKSHWCKNGLRTTLVQRSPVRGNVKNTCGMSLYSGPHHSNLLILCSYERLDLPSGIYPPSHPIEILLSISGLPQFYYMPANSVPRDFNYTLQIRLYPSTVLRKQSFENHI